jgi:hypothetical protein
MTNIVICSGCRCFMEQRPFVKRPKQICPACKEDGAGQEQAALVGDACKPSPAALEWLEHSDMVSGCIGIQPPSPEIKAECIAKKLIALLPGERDKYRLTGLGRFLEGGHT